jgi:hypothetical protein
MGNWKVEVEGRFTAVIEVEAEGSSEAESEAIRVFEQDVDVVTNMGGESWDYLGICGVEEEEEDED